ncbi:Protocadherin gamma-A2 [Aix galericulata]|nr:Protocadherin gamma-A2 [Aix galericulata]
MCPGAVSAAPEGFRGRGRAAAVAVSRACSAGRRLRAPLFTTEERRGRSGALQPAPPAAARLARSLCRRPCGIRAAPRYGAELQRLRYSVPEELPKGSFVGDVAKDLALQPAALRDRGTRVVSADRTQYFALHANSGHLVTAERLDREQLCRLVERCVLRCEVIVEGEMKVYRIEVEITDINDNAPSFRESEKELRMSEMTAPGSRFPLIEARDPDVGVNSLQSYELSGDEHFSLSVQAGADGEKRPELVLAKALDREEAAFIRVSVLDATPTPTRDSTAK